MFFKSKQHVGEVCFDKIFLLREERAVYFIFLKKILENLFKNTSVKDLWGSQWSRFVKFAVLICD